MCDTTLIFINIITSPVPTPILYAMEPNTSNHRGHFRSNDQLHHSSRNGFVPQRLPPTRRTRFLRSQGRSGLGSGRPSSRQKLSPELFVLSREYLTILRCLGHLRVLEDGPPNSFTRKSRELVNFVRPAFLTNDFHDEITQITSTWTESIMKALGAHYKRIAEEALQTLRYEKYSSDVIRHVFGVTISWFHGRRLFNREFFDHALDLILSFHPNVSVTLTSKEAKNATDVVNMHVNDNVHFPSPPKGNCPARQRHLVSVEVQTTPLSCVSPHKERPTSIEERATHSQEFSFVKPVPPSNILVIDSVPGACDYFDPTANTSNTSFITVPNTVTNSLNTNDKTDVPNITTTTTTQVASCVSSQPSRKRLRSLDSSFENSSCNVSEGRLDLLATPNVRSDFLHSHPQTRKKYKEWRLTLDDDSVSASKTGVSPSATALLIGDESLNDMPLNDSSISIQIFPECTFEHVGAIL